MKRIRSTVTTVLLLPLLLACGILNTAVNSATGGAYKPAAARIPAWMSFWSLASFSSASIVPYLSVEYLHGVNR